MKWNINNPQNEISSLHKVEHKHNSQFFVQLKSTINVGTGVPDGPHLVSNPKQQRILHIEQTPTTKQNPLVGCISYQ